MIVQISEGDYVPAAISGLLNFANGIFGYSHYKKTVKEYKK